MTTYELRPLGVGEILDRSLGLFLKHFWPLFGLTALAIVPMILVAAVIGGAMAAGVVSMDPGEVEEHIPLIIGGVAVLMLAMVFFQSLLQGATAKLVSDCYLGHDASIAGSLRHGAGVMLPVLGTSFLWGIYLIGGFLLCCVGVVWPYTVFFAAITVAAIERKGPRDSMDRAAYLSKGRRWEILATLLVGSMGAAVAGAIGQILQLVLQAAGMEWVGILVGQLLQVIVAPFLAVVTTVLYYDCRVRKEAFDLQQMARELGG
jgi:hypothetical protein